MPDWVQGFFGEPECGINQLVQPFGSHISGGGIRLLFAAEEYLRQKWGGHIIRICSKNQIKLGRLNEIV